MAEKIDCTLDDVVAALNYIHVDSREEWRIAGMAIKSEFGEGGCSTWMDWSQGYKKFKQAEANSVWKSFKGRGITIGSLFGLALSRGFQFARKEQTLEEKAEFAKACEARRIAREVELELEEAETLRWHGVVAKAASDLKPLLKTMGSSPYLGKKRVRGFGIYFAPHSFVIKTNDDFSIEMFSGGDAVSTFFDNKKEADSFVFFKKDSILIPLVDASGDLKNLQIIFTNGEKKRFLTNGRKSGYFHIIGEINTELPIVFCEGYATGASLYMATGWPVVVCFDSGNMPVVAEQFKENSQLKIIAGDNDWETALKPNQVNTGLVKAQEAAAICGGTWCVPEFAGDATGLSDFNDLQVAEGGPVVKAQLDRTVELFKARLNSPEPSFDESPPDYEDIPASAYEDYVPLDDSAALPADASPEPSFFERPDLEESLKRYALAMPDSKVWDSQDKKLLKQGSVKAFIGQKVFAEWLAHEKRRTVDISDVQRMAAAAQAEGSGGLADALARYIYLFPSSTAWDTQTRSQVALADLRNAIADCYDQWLKHPRRRNVQKENLVFDPTQQVPVGEYINTFKGLPLTPVNNEDLCRNMRHMLWCLCNKDNEIFTWLCCWLAFPLQHVGAKMQTAVLMHSRVHGSGKSFFFDGVMRGVYGEYCKTFGQAELESQYNDWISQALFGVFEEVLSRSQRYSHTGTIKQMITGQKVRINQKYMQGWEESNHMNCVFLSNEVEPLPVEPSDRRLLVIWPEEKLLDQLQTGVDAELKAGGAAAFMGWLLRVDTSVFSEHSKPPMTDAKQRLIDIGRPAWEVFYDDWVNGRTDAPYCACRVLDLYRLYQVWARERNENILASNRFSGYISSYVKKQQDVNYQCGSIVGKASFFIVGECPKGKNKSEWLGGCVAEFDRVLQKSNREAA
jgi:putative DNA primase/helicase